jgi:hypothetical protein
VFAVVVVVGGGGGGVDDDVDALQSLSLLPGLAELHLTVCEGFLLSTDIIALPLTLRSLKLEAQSKARRFLWFCPFKHHLPVLNLVCLCMHVCHCNPLHARMLFVCACACKCVCTTVFGERMCLMFKAACIYTCLRWATPLWASERRSDYIEPLQSVCWMLSIDLIYQ